MYLDSHGLKLFRNVKILDAIVLAAFAYFCFNCFCLQNPVPLEEKKIFHVIGAVLNVIVI